MISTAKISRNLPLPRGEQHFDMLGLLSSVAAAALVPGRTIGIDLGTTNSAVSIIRDDGTPCVVPNSRGELTTPSVVAFAEDGSVIVGEDALEQSASNVFNTVHAAKRFIGRPLKIVQSDANLAGCEVIAHGDDGCLFRLPALPQPIAPEEVSARLLGALLDDAERATGQRAERAVITVPAYFDEPQRVATRAAATLAGLEEVMLLPEPVAACLAHGISGATGLVLVFDLGAGTFDVSVLRISDSGSVEVVATSGDSQLGGNDWDALLVKWLADQSAKRGVNAAGEPALMRQLMQATEAAKKRLSVVKSVEVPLPIVGEGGGGEGGEGEGGGVSSNESPGIELSRARLEELCDGLFRRLKQPLYEVALSARVTLPGELDPNHGKVTKQSLTQRTAASCLAHGAPRWSVYASHSAFAEPCTERAPALSEPCTGLLCAAGDEKAQGEEAQGTGEDTARGAAKVPADGSAGGRDCAGRRGDAHGGGAKARREFIRRRPEADR